MGESNFDLTQLNEKDFDWLQIKEIKKGIEDGLDVSGYALPEISYQKMRELREGMMEGLDLRPYLKLPSGILHQLRIARQKKLDIAKYVLQGYEAEQLEQIIHALELHLDIAPYLSTNLRGVAIQEICEGLQTGMDVSVYASDKYNWQQMREIRLGLEKRLDVSKYTNPMYDAKQMREIRIGMEAGLDVSEYASLMYIAKDMKRLRMKQQELFADVVLQAEKAKQQESRISTKGAPVPGDTKTDAKNPESIPKIPEWFMVTISEDEMEAYLICNKRPKNAKADVVLEELKRIGITKGIDEEAINRTLKQVAENKPMKIASGRPAEDGRDGWYEYFFRTEVVRTPKHLEDGSVDYQNIEWFETVKKDQKLVYYHKAGNGTFGYTVTGLLLKPHKGKELPMLRGSGYILQEDGQTYISTMNGRIELRENQLIVSRLFEFDEITMATGNVDVDGNVHVKGHVGSKTVIRATGDIVIDGFVESVVIESGGNIVLRNGVNAANEGLIYAKEKIVGRFFEAAIVKCDGDIHLDYSMDSQIYAKGKIVFSGSKGLLIGGHIEAQKGLSAYNIGNSAGSLTSIQFGTSRETRKLSKEQQEKMAEIRKEIQLFTRTYEDFQKKYSPEVLNGMELYLKIENAIYTKENEYKQLRKEYDMLMRDVKESDLAEVRVRGYLYEGVLFESSGQKWKPKTVYGVRVKKMDNRITILKY